MDQTKIQASIGEMGIGEIVSRNASCTGVRLCSYKVIEQSDEFYIVDDPDGKPFAVRKDECRVETIMVSMMR